MIKLFNGMLLLGHSVVHLFVTPRTAACQASLSFTISWNLLKLMSIELVMPSNHCSWRIILIFNAGDPGTLQSCSVPGSLQMKKYPSSLQSHVLKLLPVMHNHGHMYVSI